MRLLRFSIGLAFAALMPLSIPTHAEDPFWEKVTWTTPDGVRLVGLYHTPGRPNRYHWVLLHGLGSVKGEWNTFAHELAASGDGILVYDARGHGESTKTTKSETLDYRQWHVAGMGSPWNRMPEDLGSAVEMISERYHVPLNSIAVGGASLGANVALRYGAMHPRVPAVLALSPGFEYAGIKSGDAFTLLAPRPVFIAASVLDQYAFATVQRLVRDRRDNNVRMIERPGAAHGVEMFDDDFTETVLKWMAYVEKK